MCPTTIYEKEDFGVIWIPLAYQFQGKIFNAYLSRRI